MADSRPPQRSLFPGLALLFVGLLLLVHSYRGLDIAQLFRRWWPLLIIFWGAIKLYERMVAGRSGQPRTSPISAGEIFLVLGLLCLLGVVAAGDVVKTRFAGAGLDWPARGDIFPFDLNVKPLPVPADCRITIRNGRGDISVRSADDSQIHVDGKKNIKAWNETDAEHIASSISFEIATSGDSFEFGRTKTARHSPADVHLNIPKRNGDTSTSPKDRCEIHVDDMKNIKAWNETDAEHIASAISFEIAKNGDSYEVRPANSGSDSRARVDLDISVPKGAAVTIRNERGDVSVSDMSKPVIVNTTRGDVDIHSTGGDITIDTGKGDVKVSDTKGNVKISGHGGEINVSSATGGLTIDGEFFGPIRADKIAKGVRFVSQRTDLTLTQLTGHLETGSGNLEIADAPGNLTLRTNSYDISIENAGGKLKVDNRNGNLEVRFSVPPKEDVEMTNSSSPITLILPESSNFEIGADCHSCDIDSEFSADSLKQTSTGAESHLEVNYSKTRGPKITLKTSYGSISIRKTS